MALGKYSRNATGQPCHLRCNSANNQNFGGQLPSNLPLTMPAEVSEVDMDVNAAVGHVDERLPGISCRWNVMKLWGTAVGINIS